MTAGEQLDSSANSAEWGYLDQNAFLATLFTASLAFGAILFGVFGIFYSVYALYMSQPELERPLIAITLRRLCRFLASLGILNCLTTLTPLYLLTPSLPMDKALSFGLAGSAIGLTVVSAGMAFWYMH